MKSIRQYIEILENVDRNKVNDVINKIRAQKNFYDLTGEDEAVLFSVVDEAKDKLIKILNSDNKLRTDWSQVKNFKIGRAHV